MSRMVDIERLSITLHGVSADLAQGAVHGLEAAVQRRIGGLRIDRAGNVSEIHVGPFDLPRGADATALRSLIAERLVEAINRSPTSDTVEEA